MPSFQLFRLKIFQPGQTSFLQPEEAPSAILRDMVGERPSAPLRGETVWHLGNVEPVDDDAVYCKFGKMTRDALPVLDPATGDFAEQEFATAPFTHVFLDLPTEVCAIAGEQRLAPETITLARQLAKVLERSREARRRGVVVSIGEVFDPDDLIEHLRTAYAIKKFTLALTPPNPFDAHQQFQKPFERFLKAARAEAGKTEVKGPALDSEILQELARSAGATGNDASAMVVARKGRRAEKKALKGSLVVIKRDAFESRPEQVELVAEIRVRMERIRRGDETR